MKNSTTTPDATPPLPPTKSLRGNIEQFIKDAGWKIGDTIQADHGEKVQIVDFPIVKIGKVEGVYFLTVKTAKFAATAMSITVSNWTKVD